MTAVARPPQRPFAGWAGLIACAGLAANAMADSTERNHQHNTPESLAWAIEYLPHYFTDQPAEFHAELFRDLQRSGTRLLARVAPRGHAKSTCAAFAYPLWCICEQRKKNIAIITHESSLATQFVRDIRSELECNDDLIAAYGDLSDHKQAKSGGARAKWTDTILTTSTGVTIQAKGSGAGFRGTRVGPNRPDLIICDDIEKDDLVQSPRQRKKLENWLRRVVMPALAPGGQLLVLGSIIHYDSLLANLCDRATWPRWDYRVYRAFEAEPADDGKRFLKKALWPARWPVEKLEIERERIGTLAFEQEYQANPIDDSIRVFRPEWLQRYDERELEQCDLVNLMAVDPATGSSSGDYFALWLGSIDMRTGIIYTRRLTLERIGIVDQIKRIIAAFDEFHPVKIGIETNAYQVALKDMLDEHSRKKRLYMPIVGIHSTQNKIARIQGSAPFYENGSFKLPAVLDPEVESQFLHFPSSGKDDAPDVCAMGIALARTLRACGDFDGATSARNPFARKGGW